MRVDQPSAQKSASLDFKNRGDTQESLVIIVDDDASVREALSELIESAGYRSACFASTQELLKADVLDIPGCLILDVRMPGTTGLDLQNQLVRGGNPKPIIFLTGHGDIPMTVQAMKAGAVDFFAKPVRDQTLLDAVAAGIATDAARRAQDHIIKRNTDRLNTLTQRERQVFQKVASGRLNKQIAFDLGISEVTVKLHRGNVMRKMEVTSIGELILAWESLPVQMRETSTNAGLAAKLDRFG